MELSDRLYEAEERIGSIVGENADRRLARFLLTAPGRYHPDDGSSIVVTMTKAELAAWVGARRETIERRLKNWRERGIVETGYREITVTDIPALTRIAGDDLPMFRDDLSYPPSFVGYLPLRVLSGASQKRVREAAS